MASRIFMNWKTKKSLCRNLLFTAILGLSNSALAAGIEVASTSVDSKNLKLPKITIDGLDYRAVSFEYAVEGDVKVLEKTKKKELLNCKGKQKENTYYEVNYKGPDIIFAVKDNRKVRDLYVEKINTEDKAFFNQNNCDNVGDLAKAFKKQQKEWAKEAKKESIRLSIVKMQEFVEKNAAPSHHEMTFKMFYVKDGGEEFKAFQTAYDEALKGFRNNRIYSLTFNAMDSFEEAAIGFEIELERVKDKGSKYDDVKMALYRNLTMTHFYAAHYDKALEFNQMALDNGLDKKDSKEAMIKEYWEGQKASPTSATNIIAQLNRWRLGHEIVKNVKLKEVDYAKLKPSLSSKGLAAANSN